MPIITDPAQLTFGVWKYVVADDETVTFVPVESGIQHRQIVPAGRLPIAAGCIASMTTGAWMHLDASSETLGISGDSETDKALLARIIGTPATE